MNKILLIFLLLMVGLNLGGGLTQEAVHSAVDYLTLPEGFVHQPRMTKDSRAGTVISQDGSLTMYYDIGMMAGMHMGPHKRSTCVWYKEYGPNIAEGLLEVDRKKQWVLTITNPLDKTAWRYPANFWAEISDEKDIQTLEWIALSYKPDQMLPATLKRKFQQIEDNDGRWSGNGGSMKEVEFLGESLKKDLAAGRFKEAEKTADKILAIILEVQ